MPQYRNAELYARSEALLQLAEQAYGRRFPRPRIQTDLRGLQAGQAFPEDNRIRLNGQLLNEYGAAFIHDTLPHELAHLVVHHLHGRRVRPHGKQWQAVMELFGATPERCHSYAVQPARRIARYSYRCQCQTHELSAIRHRRAQRGQHYLCIHCGQMLVQVETANVCLLT